MGDHPDILNYFSTDEVKEKSDDVNIGLVDRGKRQQDTKELKIIHVEDKW